MCSQPVRFYQGETGGGGGGGEAQEPRYGRVG